MKKNYTLFTLLVFLISCFSVRSQWSQTTTPPGGSIWALVTVGTNIVAGASNGGVYVSSDDGATWIQRNGSFPDMEVRSLATNGSDLFVGTSGPYVTAIYKSGDLGITWVNITPPGMSGIITGLTLDGTDIYACSDAPVDGMIIGHGIYKSSTIGIDSSSWTQFSTGFPMMPAVTIRSLKVNGTNIYAGTYGNGVWVSSTSSPGWSATSGMVSDGDYVQTISFNGSIGFAGNISGDPVLYRSIDNGLNWVQSSTSVFDSMPVYSIINNATAVFAGTEKNGVMKSPDNGISWTTFNEGFKDSSGNWFCNHMNIRSMVFKGNTIFAGTDCGVWKRSLDAAPVQPPVEPGTPVVLKDSSISFYPNPAGNTITLKVEQDDIGSMCLIKDATGSIVIQKRLTNETTSVEISRLLGGIYFIQVGNKRAVKLIKK